MALVRRFVAGLAVVTLGVGTGVGVEVAGQATAGALVTITVNDAGDAAPVPANCTATPTEGDCTLRAAIEAANAATDDTTITLPDANTVPNNPSASHIYTVNSSPGGELDLNASGHTITINGPGASLAIIQMNAPVTTRAMEVESGTTADISAVTIEHGNTAAFGGGILNNGGDLTLSDSSVVGNTALSGGGVAVASGTTTLTNDAIDTNTVTGAGGGVYFVHGTNSASGGTISANTSTNSGGGIYIQDNTAGDSAVLTGVTVDSNSAANSGGGAYVENSADSPGNPVTLTNDSFDSNSATNSGGGAYLENSGTGDTVTVTGGSMSSNSASEGVGGGVYVENSGTNVTVSVDGVNIDSNTALGAGGGAYVENSGTTSTVTFSSDSVNENAVNISSDGEGGGIYDENSGSPSQASFIGGSISSNVAYEGGGVYVEGGANTFSQETVDGNQATEAGGGFEFATAQAGASTISQSAITDNRVEGLVGVSLVLGDGGGILSFECNAIALTNDTIANNLASANGGGYYGVSCAESPTVTTAFNFDTITGNTALDGTTGAGNIQRVDDSTLTTANSIIAGGISGTSPTTNCAFSGPGSFTSLGYNLIDDTTCGTPGTGDIIGQSPQLGALGANGGPTNTELPATGSPAIGGVPATVCTATGVTTDQRGNARGAGLNGTCTIGSVEVSVAAPSLNLNGYRLVANEGGIFDFGLNFHGSLANNHLNAPIVGIANSPGYDGYLMAGGDGGVFALGGANFYGSLGGQKLPSPISAIAAPPAENGYWLVAQNGKIYNFGAAPALPAVQVPSGAHIVGMASTQDGGGGWLTDNLGDVYAEGDALYVGGLGGVHLNAPIVGIAAAASGQGYALAASDGGVFNYGTQHFFGSVPGSLAPGQKLVAPIVGIAVTHSGNGYWLVGSDGGVFNYGDAPFLGSIYTAIGNHPLNGPIVGIQHLGELPTA
jgi:hypothetical protein